MVGVSIQIVFIWTSFRLSDLFDQISIVPSTPYLTSAMGALPPLANKTVRVLIAGGSYAGISAAVNLLDLCHGKAARLAPDKVPSEKALLGVPVKITIVDERDGYCMFMIPLHVYAIS